MYVETIGGTGRRAGELCPTGCVDEQLQRWQHVHYYQEAQVQTSGQLMASGRVERSIIGFT